MINILLTGYCGFMGREVKRIADESADLSVTAGVDPQADGREDVPCAKSFEQADRTAHCIIDFSNHACTKDLLDFAVGAGMPAVIATTGQTEDEIAMIKEASKKIPIFFSANMSLGIALLAELAKKTAAAMPGADIEIIEKHHNRKLDAPSGTAKLLFDSIKEARPTAYPVMGRGGQAKREKNEIGMHSLRMGNVVGEHEVIISTASQTISLKHEAHNRALFAEGAIAAARFLTGKSAGLYTMNDMVKE